jgi:hypothetical protein
LKQKQAMALGHLHAMAVKKKIDQLVSGLRHLSDLEQEFETSLTREVS